MSHKQLTDTEFDALVVRSLSRLPTLAPSRAFEAGVMARVRLPQPRPVALVGRARAWVTQPGRAIVLAGGYAALALIALGVAVPWLIRHGSQVGFGLDWIAGRSLGLVREAGAGFAAWALSSGLADWLQSRPFTAPLVLAFAGTAAAAYAGGAVGLHFLLRAPRGHDAPVPLQA